MIGRVDMGADEVGEKQADFTRNGMEIGEETGPGSAPKTDPPGGYYKPPAGGVKRLLSFPAFILLHRFAKPVALAVHIEDMAMMRQAI